MLRVTQCGLDVLVAESLADSRQADAVLHQCGRVAVAKLMKCAIDTNRSTVCSPACLGRLVAKPLTIAVLQRPKQWHTRRSPGER